MCSKNCISSWRSLDGWFSCWSSSGWLIREPLDTMYWIMSWSLSRTASISGLIKNLFGWSVGPMSPLDSLKKRLSRTSSTHSLEPAMTVAKKAIPTRTPFSSRTSAMSARSFSIAKRRATRPISPFGWLLFLGYMNSTGGEKQTAVSVSTSPQNNRHVKSKWDWRIMC